LIQLEIPGRQVAIYGRVTDAQDKKPIRDVEILITGMPAAFKRRMKGAWRLADQLRLKTRTRPDGFFYFLDLPDGKYTFQASLPRLGKRYGAVHESITVSRDDRGRIKRGFLALALQPTAVTGKITAAAQRAGVVMAEVRIKGSGERAFTDTRGQYVLAGIEPGNRTVVIVAQGYRPVSQAVTLKEPGEVQNLNFSLVKEVG
jgi:hypothetical protein